MTEIEDDFIDWAFLNYDMLDDLKRQGYSSLYFAPKAPALDVEHVVITDEFRHGDIIVTKRIILLPSEYNLWPLDSTKREIAVERIMQYFENRPEPIEIVDPRYNQVGIVLPCARPGCKWQGSKFDDRGPYGHVESQTKRGAVEQLVEDGFTEIEIGALKRVVPSLMQMQGVPATARGFLSAKENPAPHKIKIKLSTAQVAALEARGLDDPYSEGEQILADAWTGTHLEFYPQDAEAISDALTEASNAEDGFADEYAHKDPAGAKYAKAASKSLSAIGSKVWKIAVAYIKEARQNPRPYKFGMESKKARAYDWGDPAAFATTYPDEREHEDTQEFDPERTTPNPALAAGMSPRDFDPSALRRGTRVEMEHTDDPRLAERIAMDHLVEHPDYYERLAAARLNPSGSSYAEAKAQRDSIEEELDAATADLKAFPRGAMGLVSDSVKASPAYRVAKLRADKAFAKLRAFNGYFAKQFKKEIREEHNNRYKSNPPFSGYDKKYPEKKHPADPTKISYKLKRDALNVFIDHNSRVIDDVFDGLDRGHPDSYDNINHRFELKGKRRVDTFAKALWLAMPAGSPYYLEDIDVNMLNDTPAMQINGKGQLLTIPDYIEEARLIQQQAEYWEDKYGGVFPEEDESGEVPF